MLSGFMYILTIMAMSLQYPNGVCMPPPKIVYCFHCKANLLILPFRYQKKIKKPLKNLNSYQPLALKVPLWYLEEHHYKDFVSQPS